MLNMFHYVLEPRKHIIGVIGSTVNKINIRTTTTTTASSLAPVTRVSLIYIMGWVNFPFGTIFVLNIEIRFREKRFIFSSSQLSIK